MSHWYKQIMREVSHFGTQEWLMLMIVAVVIGFLALRGVSRR